MRLLHLPHCLKCDSGKSPRVIVDMTDTPQVHPPLLCGSCLGAMEPSHKVLTIKELTMIEAIRHLIIKNFGDNGRTVGAFEIIDWGYLTANAGKPDYRVILEAREAPGYQVELQACSQLGALSTPNPGVGDEHKLLRRGTMPSVLAQAVDSLNYWGFSGRQRSRDDKQHWVYLDRQGKEKDSWNSQLCFRAKLTWPVG